MPFDFEGIILFIFIVFKCILSCLGSHDVIVYLFCFFFKCIKVQYNKKTSFLSRL